jgi:FkbM family methyltransferase
MKLDRKIVIFDIGCRWGFAKRFTENPGIFQTFGFDPDTEECKNLNEQYGNDSVAIVPVALAGSNGRRTLFITQEPACSSLLVPDPALTENYPALNCARQVASKEIDTVTLDDWVAENNVTAIDYMKIDTQGTELEILRGSITTLQQVRCLEVEVEFNRIYLNQPLFSDVDQFLRDQGFVLWKLTNQVHYSRKGMPEVSLGEDSVFYDDRQRVQHAVFGGQLYWANAHFVKLDVLSLTPQSEFQKMRDISLFDSIDMPDVVDHLRESSSVVTEL